MKKKRTVKKQLLFVFCMMVFLLIFSGCSQISSDVAIDNKDTLTSNAESYLDSWNSTNFDDYIAQNSEYLDDTTTALYQSWQKTKNEIGEYDSICDRVYSKTDDTTIVTLRAKYSKKTIDFSVTFDQSGEVSDTSVEIYSTMSEKLGKAGLNTVMSMGLVFVVLIFISFIISLFKYISKVEKSGKKEEIEVVKAPKVEEVAVQEDVTDDLELVAVVTAAIMASMGDEVPADGLVVKSIKRRKLNKWHSA